MITGHISSTDFCAVSQLRWRKTSAGVAQGRVLSPVLFFYALLIQARRAVGGLRPSAQIKAPATGCSEHLENHGWPESE